MPLATASRKKAKTPKPSTAPNAFKQDPATIKFEGEAKTLLREAMQAQGMTHGDLNKALAKIGVHMGEQSLINKISRGGFSSAFLLQCMTAMGLELAPKPRR